MSLRDWFKGLAEKPRLETELKNAAADDPFESFYCYDTPAQKEARRKTSMFRAVANYLRERKHVTAREFSDQLDEVIRAARAAENVASMPESAAGRLISNALYTERAKLIAMVFTDVMSPEAAEAFVKAIVEGEPTGCLEVDSLPAILRRQAT